MEEKFLHYTWKYKLFDPLNLVTTKGQRVEVMRSGEHNLQSGPDFFNAQIRIDGTVWAGNLEIHVNSSEWNQHRHQFDKAYDNVVLHVVYEHDEEILNARGEAIPTLELKGLIPISNIQRYNQLRQSPSAIPCGRQVSTVPSVIMKSWFERLHVERLEEKTLALEEILASTKNDWEGTFYLALARNFGFKTNALPFYLLAKSLPLRILLKHCDEPMYTEALLFGQAGMLSEHLDGKFPRQLQNEYEFFMKKYQLIPLEKSIWKFGRMRPAAFPGVRIAQFAALVKNMKGMFSRMLEMESVGMLDQLFSPEPSPYWKDHYAFGISSPPRSKKLGHESIQNIAVNTIVPLIFLYGQKSGQQIYREKAQRVMEQLAAENNTVVRTFQQHGLQAENALETQALIQLKNKYCDRKRCLDCRIGFYLLND